MPTAGLGGLAPINRLKQFTAFVLAADTLVPRPSHLQYNSRNWPDERRNSGKNRPCNVRVCRTYGKYVTLLSSAWKTPLLAGPFRLLNAQAAIPAHGGTVTKGAVVELARFGGFRNSKIMDGGGDSGPQNGADDQTQSKGIGKRPGSGGFVRCLFGRADVIGGSFGGHTRCAHRRRTLGILTIRVSTAALKAT